MTNNDPLPEFEKLTGALRQDAAPHVHVATRVLARIRTTETPYDWTLAFMAAASCVAALLVAVVGLSWMSSPGNSLEALFQIVPPIGL